MNNLKAKKIMGNNLPFTNEQIGKICCGKEMVLTETHEEKNNKICRSYVCSQCGSRGFGYGKKTKETITLTAKQYKDLMTKMRNLSEEMIRRQEDIYRILCQANAS